MGVMGIMGIMGMMSKRTERQKHCCCMADSFSLDRATVAAGGFSFLGDTNKERGQLPGRMLTSPVKKGGDLLSRIAVQYHRRARA